MALLSILELLKQLSLHLLHLADVLGLQSKNLLLPLQLLQVVLLGLFHLTVPETAQLLSCLNLLVLDLLFTVLVLLKHLLQVLILYLLSLNSTPLPIDIAVSLVFVDALSEFQIPLLTLFLVLSLQILKLV